jgi:predicted ATP-dependent serine protease
VQEAIAATAAGAPRAILIEGPAGIGKMALLLEARQGAERAVLRVLSARGGELERELAWAGTRNGRSARSAGVPGLRIAAHLARVTAHLARVTTS